MSEAAGGRVSRSLALLVFGVAGASVLAVSAVGVGGAWLATAASVAWAWLSGGVLAGAYVAAGWGLGAALLSRMADRSGGVWLAPAVGLGLMLTLSHAMGLVGAFDWFGSGGRRVMAGLPIVAGLLLLAMDLVRRGSGQGVSIGGGVLAAAPGLAVLVVASASPTGWLWASEGFGYDTRSYHMQLPAEWLSMGRLWPLEHNVYSYLPGYVESAFYHVLAMTGEHPAAGGGLGLLAGQCLSAVMALLAAVLIGRVCWVVMGAGQRSGIATAMVGLVLGTPWVIVVGSLAYNEPAVLALGAGAMIAALSKETRLVTRWALAAFLVGSACGAKPTALFMVGPVVGLLLLAGTPRKALLKCLGVGVLVGVLTLLPWLVRNELAAGNPVFPQLAGVFGSGHWTAEQHARWASGHRFDGSVFDRVRLLFLPDAGSAFAGTSMRGLLHPHWGLLGAVGVLAAIVGPVVRPERVVLALVAGLCLQIVAWLALTHLQSRFLLPVVLCGVPLAAVVAARLGRVGVWVALVLAVLQGGWSVLTYAGERGGNPGLAIAPGVAVFTGRLEPDASPTGVVNFGLSGAGGGVLLVGDGAPLYYLDMPLYATTWDVGELVEAIEAHRGDASAQARALRAAGVRWLVIDEMELSRLRESGWLHPLLTPRAIGELAGQGEPAGYWAGPGALGRILIDLGP